MMTPRIVLATLLAASTIPTARGAQLPAEPIALVNGRVLDVVSGRLRSVTVVLRGGRIEAVAGPVPPGIRAIDLDGHYVVPGLIDAHVHLETLRAMRTALESGVTTARSAGVAHYADVGLRDLVTEGAVAGPDVLASGYHLRRSLAEEAFVSHPDLAPLLGGVITADDLRRVARANAARRVDWIKVMASERAGTPDTDPRKSMYSEAELRAVVEEATALKLPVQAHAHGQEGALAAVRAGVRSIEHGTYLPDEAIQLMAKRGTFLDPTIEVIKDMTEPGGDYDHHDLQLRGRLMLPRVCETVARAHKAGVAIAAGSDSGYRATSVGRVGAEIRNLTECGLSPLAALQSATLVNARLLMRDTQIGQIAAGFEADLLVVERNPLQHLDALQDPLLVVSNGRVGLNRLSAGAQTLPRAQNARDGCATISERNSDDCVRLNEIQVLGTHNSYHIAPPPALQSALGERARDADYTHRPLAEQLSRLGIRQFELDVFADPDGGRYASPAALRMVKGLEPPGPELRAPGLKVLHVQDIDYLTTCPTLVSCLTVIRDWSLANPRHVPIMILIEAKDSVPRDPDKIGFVQPLPFDREQLLAIDAAIRTVFAADHVITPDRVRGRFETLAGALKAEGWPTLRASRGKVLFALDNTEEPRLAYLQGAPALQGRMMFVSSPPGEPSAAFLKLNEVLKGEEDAIRRAVAGGYLVRTRADIPTQEARSGSTVRRDAAFRSGAHYVSTDYPEDSPFGSGYRARLPGAENRPARCNPVTAPKGCRHEWLE